MNKKDFRAFFIRQKLRTDIGRSNAGIIQWLMLLFVTIKTALPNYSIILTALITLSTIFLLWLFGFFWDTSKMYEEEVEFQNARNRFVKEARQEGVKVKP